MEGLAVVDTQTGEYIPAGSETLPELAEQFNQLESRTVEANKEKGRILATARAKCEDPDCGIPGDNPDHRYGNWVALNMSDTPQQTLHRYRRQWEVFGDRFDDPVIARIPQSGRYKLAAPEMDLFRERAIAILSDESTISIAMVDETLDMLTGSNVLATKHTGDEESYTPGEYIESARAVMGSIDMDPASNDMAQETVKADVYFTVEDDGLAMDWSGNVWMNPPYTAMVINKFIEKLVEHYIDGDVKQAIVLTNNNTDTSWFHIGAKYASAICFTAGRINFLKRDGSKSSPTNGQSFFYFGSDTAAFVAEFSQYGLVMEKSSVIA